MYCNFLFSIMFAAPWILLNKGTTIRDDLNPSTCFNRLFPLAPDKGCIFIDGSKAADRPFAGFTVVDVSENCIHRF